MGKEQIRHSWLWAYKKIRSLGCSKILSFYRATIYKFRGDTGAFFNKSSNLKIRLKK